MDTILTIEDDTDTRDLLRYIIRDAGYDCSALSHIPTIAYIRDLNPTLILLDHWVNDGYGDELCIQIKSRPETAHIPIVLVSASNGLEEISSRCRADAFIAKPFELSELLELIEKFMPAS